ncbi:rna-directed dna polymerase from mobile element jockey-like [Limosa lapponica baueri]|uniref:Rna-directed dna polymerase from mobile element jockey-like n=1 Tax=Limosa lapponica baueri TaxID=1758121 RepID=A0A2I0UN93_LIMLA|nr:rna-directed dna polymerase from mobile element jockey-like [Limosa lapponica baueri]
MMFPGSLSTMTGLVDETRTVKVFYLYFRMAFDTVTHQILMEKLMKYRLDEQPISMRWSENWMNGWPEKVLNSLSDSETFKLNYENVQDNHVQSAWLMKGRFSLTNLISFYDKVTHLVDEGKAVDIVYVDFSKAFDTISHSIPLEKLAAHGLDGRTLHWVKTGWVAGPKELWRMKLNPVGSLSQVVFSRRLSTEASSV